MDEVVVGFEGKAKEIRDWLTHGSKKLDIISIIGMAGLGKTTLAKKVYNDPLVKRHFTICAWCTVSQSYDSKKLLLDILKDVTEVKDSFNEMEEEDLADMLRKCLKGKKYLIVFDDIWDVGAWNVLKLSLPDDEQYSRILFTSRIHNVVLDAKSNSFPYLLSQLSDQESWELLERRLFNNKDICPRNFVQHGKQIAIDCKGLPLAVVLVAGLLKKEINNLDWWKQIGESLDSRISKGGCANILELSYKHLSEPLKVCFLYLGLFQEDKVIQVQKLINLWVSEGFIEKKNMKDVEIVAKEYVMDLIGRSLLLVSDKSSNGGIKTCRIHDLLREFCMEKSKEEHFFKLLHGKYVSHSTMDEHYRVSIQTQHWKYFFVRKSSPLYSIHICPGDTYYNAINISPNSFCNAIYLHVLDLEEAEFDGDFPEEITTLIFLRYLAIWCTTKFIPAAIGRLGKLETLRIISKETFLLPTEILRMQSLRHVHIGKFFLRVLFGNILPMKNILSFSIPCLNYGKGTESFLSKLRTIQKLKCQFSSYKQNQMVKLDFLNQLESLNMIHDGHPRLHSFVFSLPTNIMKLTLSNFGLPWSEISRIADLPNLEVLKLLVDSFVGKFWDMGAEEFRRLKFLKLQGLNVQKWSASHENFPSLLQIVVEQCHKLEEIPIEFIEISTLRKIQIRRCRSSVVKSAKEIEDEQIELGTLKFKMEAVQILSEKLFG